jgi:hypothetical protein
MRVPFILDNNTSLRIPDSSMHKNTPLWTKKQSMTGYSNKSMRKRGCDREQDRWKMGVRGTRQTTFVGLEKHNNKPNQDSMIVCMDKNSHRTFTET